MLPRAIGKLAVVGHHRVKELVLGQPNRRGEVDRIERSHRMWRNPLGPSRYVIRAQTLIVNGDGGYAANQLLSQQYEFALMARGGGLGFLAPGQASQLDPKQPARHLLIHTFQRFLNSGPVRLVEQHPSQNARIHIDDAQ